MRLEAVERALALLYTDARFRERFYEDPRRAGAEIGLESSEIDRLLEVDRSRVEAFADSLVGKRFGEVERLLPRLRAAIGHRALAEHFRAFARTTLPAGVHKHQADAMAFADHIASIETGDLRDAARFDRAVLGLFYRLKGSQARARRGPSVAVVRRGGRMVLLYRAWGSSRIRLVGSRAVKPAGAADADASGIV